jgi:hypothetical protein
MVFLKNDKIWFFGKTKKIKLREDEKIFIIEDGLQKIFGQPRGRSKKICNSMATELKILKIFFQSGLTDVDPVKKNFKFLKPCR